MAGTQPIMTDRVTFSAVIPCYNEAENAANIAFAVRAELERAGEPFEIIFIDNASTDGTADIIKRLCLDDPRIRLIVNNQNYGQMRSPVHAIFQTSGEAVIGVAADFQDPPELISVFIERWRAGAMIVLGVRAGEKTTAVLRLIRKVGYAFFERFGDYRVIPNATGFGLYDRRVVEIVKRWRDPEPFFRGMLVESGYSVETIPYQRPQRAGGETKNNLASLFGFAVSGLASSSRRLLRAPIVFSLVVFALSAVSILAGLVAWVLSANPLPGLAGGLILFAYAVVLFFLGLIGEQVRVLSQIARDVPLVVEKERINFPKPGMGEGREPPA